MVDSLTMRVVEKPALSKGGDRETPGYFRVRVFGLLFSSAFPGQNLECPSAGGYDRGPGLIGAVGTGGACQAAMRPPSGGEFAGK